MFLSTLSLRRATLPASGFVIFCGDFYPRSPCGERQCARGPLRARAPISIHALLAESDCHCRKTARAADHFYPRSPCGERLLDLADAVQQAGISIHALLAESDISSLFLPRSRTYFYPRSPCGERPRQNVLYSVALTYFYPRSPCGERQLLQQDIRRWVIFLSTLSLRRATTMNC